MVKVHSKELRFIGDSEGFFLIQTFSALNVYCSFIFTMFSECVKF